MSSYTADQLHQRYTWHYRRVSPGKPEAAFHQYALNLGAFLPEDGSASLLDIGCGIGRLLLFLQERGYTKAEGIEASEDQVAECRKLGLRQIRHVLDTEKYLLQRSGQYHVIFALDVIEHIPKERVPSLLAAIHNALVPNGIFIMRVPNMAAASGIWCRYMDFTHEVGFTEISARQLFELAGFSEIHVLSEKTHYNHKLRGIAFEMIRRTFRVVLKAEYFLERPGSQLPKVFTSNLYAVGRAR